jgi:hypothetical protein
MKRILSFIFVAIALSPGILIARHSHPHPPLPVGISPMVSAIHC